MDSSVARNAAYADFLGGLTDLREDVATGRFDQTLAELLASGALDSATADLLRFWQRETLRTQTDQLVSVAAVALAALDTARQEAARSVAAAEQIWTTVTTGAADSAPTPPVHDSAPVRGAAEEPTATEQPTGQTAPGPALAPTAEERNDRTAATAEIVESLTPSASRGRHRAPSHAVPVATEPVVAEPVDTEPVATEPVVAEPVATEPLDGSPPARRRRLLVAGLTVVDKADEPPESPTHGHPAVG